MESGINKAAVAYFKNYATIYLERIRETNNNLLKGSNLVTSRIEILNVTVNEPTSWTSFP